MRHWSLTLHGPSGILHTIDSGESEFVLGAETGPDMFSVTGEGVAARHAWVSIGGGGLLVEDLAGGTLVNGAPIEGRVSVDTPAAIQIGSVTIVIEARNGSVQEQPQSAEAQNLGVIAGSELDIETTMAFGMEMQGAVTGQVFDVGTRYTKQDEIGRGAEGLTEWKQPSKEFEQDDEHPLVMVSWNQAKVFCEWLSEKTGKEWHLPTNAEWEAAVGTAKYLWGDYYPPQWDDGNYASGTDGKVDPDKVGVDGIMGTAPVASFKANTLGFYDLGGNVCEWMWDEVNEKTSNRVIRGGDWRSGAEYCAIALRNYANPGNNSNGLGFRVALSNQ